MKKFRRLLPIATAALMLFSCTANYDAETLEESQAAVKELETTTTYTTYTPAPEGHAGDYDTFLTPEETAIPSGETATVADGGESYLFDIPTRLTEANYYEADEKGSVNVACAYQRLYDLLGSDTDYTNHLQFKKDGEELVFYTENISKNLTLYHLVNKDGPQKLKASIKVYGRFNLEVRYDKAGLILSESAKLVNEGSATASVNVVVNYQYQ